MYFILNLPFFMVEGSTDTNTNFKISLRKTL